MSFVLILVFGSYPISCTVGSLAYVVPIESALLGSRAYVILNLVFRFPARSVVGSNCSFETQALLMVISSCFSD